MTESHVATFLQITGHYELREQLFGNFEGRSLYSHKSFFYFILFFLGTRNCHKSSMTNHFDTPFRQKRHNGIRYIGWIGI